jgi:triosephosphate isomerase
MRTPLIAGNWKMNTIIEEAVALAGSLVKPLDDIENVEKLVCPPFISLGAVSELLAKSSIKVGAQNMHYDDKGAFTGEISPLMIKDIAVYVIIGIPNAGHTSMTTFISINNVKKRLSNTESFTILCHR